MYHSTDFEVHRNWLAVTHSTPLKEWYWENTSEWTLDYPPLFGYFQWALSQAAVWVEPDLVELTPYYEPSEAAVWFQRVSVMVMDATLVLGVIAWCKGVNAQDSYDATRAIHLGVLVLLNSGLLMVDHVHFQYNGFLLGLLLLSMGLIKQGKVLAGGAAFACLLMLKHLFLSLAPLYFVYLLRHFCFERSTTARTETKGLQPRDRDAFGTIRGVGGGTGSKGRQVHSDRPHGAPSSSRSQGELAEAAPLQGEHAERFSFKRLVSLGAVVLGVFLSALGPQCVSGGWTKEACLRQLNQLAVRLFPFGRGLVHAYWAPNAWAVYLFVDRVLLAALKVVGWADASAGTGSTTGGLVRTEVMAVLPPVPAGACLLLSVLACYPALVRAWRSPSPQVFAWGVMHCSLSAFMVGFHVHEKALLVPAVVSALLALDSEAGARMHLRLSFLAAFAVLPLLPGPELKVLKAMLVITHLAVATSLLEHRHSQSMALGEGLQSGQPLSSGEGRSSSCESPKEASAVSRTTPGSAESLRPSRLEVPAGPCLWTAWDRAYVAGAGVVWVLGELVHPWVLGPGRLPFLPLMGVSVFGAVGVVACWGLSAVDAPVIAKRA
eukprot:g1964.t1